MNMMHEMLRTKFAWYDRWHKNIHADTVTWALFLMFAFSYTTLSLAAIAVHTAEIDRVANTAIAQQALTNAGPRAVGSAAEERLKVVSDTMLVKANEHARAALASRSERLTELKASLTERMKVLEELALTDAATVRRYILDEETYKRLPEDARAFAEKPFSKSGKYQLYLVSEFFNGQEKAHEEYFLEVAPGERYRLALSETEAAQFLGDTTVEVLGMELLNGVIVPTVVDEVVEGDEDATVLGASTVKNIAVIPINFAKKVVQPQTVDALQKIYFTDTNSVAAHMREASDGKWDITGKVFDWVTITDEAATCDYYGWATKAREIIAARGESLTGYTNLHYLPINMGVCGWGGVANMPGTQSWVIAEYATYRGIIVHELGHNYGFHHAITPTSEYGDQTDPMGSAAFIHYSNYNKGRFWAGSDKYTTVTAAGTYTLNELKSTSTGPIGIRVPRKDGTTNHFLLEYRGAGGFDNALGTSYRDRVIVRSVPSTFITAKTTYLAAIAPGSSYTSSVDGITISVLSSDGKQATVKVDMVTVPCTTVNPTVTASPSGQWGEPGSARTYTLTVKNNDSSSCSSSAFSVTPTLPSGFTQVPSPLSITLAPGAQGSISYSVTSPTTAQPGTYPIVERVTHGSDGTKSGSVTVNYNVSAPDTVAPVVSISAPVNGTKLSGSKVNVTASASDPSGVATLQIQINGAVVKTCSGVTSCTHSWSLRKVPAGTHTIRAVAVDNAAARNQATTEIIVTK